ncbi:MAG TPA: ATP-dependent DNA helicase RecG [Verrucomicrobiae bacterium]|jgi:ATP-dependent DNA helicase RecG|nr:ATP-dependent DNA helicase RecG [Verrucomicrobiae bacterium]
MSAPSVTATSAPVAPDPEPLPPLKRPVVSLWGVGPDRAALLARLGILTIEDLLLNRPRRYEDRRHFKKISELQKGEQGTARGRIVAMGLKRFRHGTKSVFEVVLDDGSARLHCRWWNLPFMEKYFARDDEVFVFGKLIQLKPRTIDHPETEVIEPGEEGFIHIARIAPIYSLTEGLPQRWLRGLTWRTLEQFQTHLNGSGPVHESEGVAQVSKPAVSPISKSAGRPNAGPSHDEGSMVRSGNLSVSGLPDTLLPSRESAIRMIHFPEELSDVEIARQRLALEEFVEFQRQIQARRKKFEANVRALPCGGDNRLMKPFLAALGFKLTGAQTQVLREIRADMGGAHPMRRLLQGDVGSGKTVVAACSALMAIESGCNVALMAPTEILAEQHFANFKKWFEPLGLRVELQTGSRKAEKLEAARSPVMVVGTHALFSSGFDLPKPGLVIIDEQHRFGVAQREQLVRKGNYPHVLVMTATPIPRTLGLTLYGDLDVSVIDAMPAGRGTLRTFVRTTDKLPKVYDFIREKIAADRQAYVVYPRVEESGDKELKAVTAEFENLKKIFAPFSTGLLHGKLSAREKETVMFAFRANQLKVLLATSLIEVGVDVPNATVMMIENAERFGLAQLHQLRGRIGRGGHASFCVLISDAKNLEARQRLRILEDTADGFKIAEADLKLRGPGELLGREQSGMPNFRFGSLTDDLELIRGARDIVKKEMRM